MKSTRRSRRCPPRWAEKSASSFNGQDFTRGITIYLVTELEDSVTCLSLLWLSLSGRQLAEVNKILPNFCNLTALLLVSRKPVGPPPRPCAALPPPVHRPRTSTTCPGDRPEETQ